ncbi:MAG: YicC family protein [Dysgonamonadaceae bacterium]|jgi:uncharacterized protein (TIGR00255 family)|nr:YicC family protein [Dysgonamonadaceae bacterium]
MIQSMTGFGKAIIELPGKKISIEIKSLNSKQLDLNTRVPNIYREKELEIRAILSQAIERGKVDFYITVEHTGTTIPSQINQTAVENYYEQIKEIAVKLNIAVPSDWFSLLLRLPETIKTDISEWDENEWEVVKKTIYQALKAFNEFREQEGAMLENIFTSKINNIKNLLTEIETYEQERILHIKTKIQEGIKKLEMTNYDENRFEQEMIYYIEKLDVNEEKTRLGNHLKYFVETMVNEKKQGRKLGFIVQEMGREINTLGSKSYQAEMQKVVVRMKDELEQIKEQILNVL